MKRYLRERLLKSDFARNVLILVTGTTIAQAIPFALSPVIARLFTKEDFGYLSIFVSLVAILSVIATGRYEMAIILPAVEKKAMALLKAVLILSALVTGLLYVILGLIWPFYGAELDSFLPLRYLLLVPVSVFLVGTYQGSYYWFNRSKDYKRLSKKQGYTKHIHRFSQCCHWSNEVQCGRSYFLPSCGAGCGCSVHD